MAHAYAELEAYFAEEALIEDEFRRNGGDRVATESDAMTEYARNVGAHRRNEPYVLTGFDVWVSNPHYRGPEMPHPEDDDAWTDLAGWRAHRAEAAAQHEADNKLRAALTTMDEDLEGGDCNIPF